MPTGKNRRQISRNTPVPSALAVPAGPAATVPVVKGKRKTEDMTYDEIAEEARAAQKLVKQFGFYDSGLMHLGVLHRQYKRTCEATGRMPYGSTLKASILGLPMGLVILAICALLPVDGNSLTSVEGVSGPYFSLARIVVLALGGAGGAGLCTCVLVIVLRVSSEWPVAYAESRIAQYAESPDGNRKVICLMETPMMRLCLFDRYGESLFSGNNDKSGFNNGRLALETHLPLATCHDDDLYAPGSCWKPAHGNTGLNAGVRRDGYRTAEHAGEFMAAHGKPDEDMRHGLGEWLTQHQALVLLAGAVAAAVLLLMLGIENQSLGEVLKEYL